MKKFLVSTYLLKNTGLGKVKKMAEGNKSVFEDIEEAHTFFEWAAEDIRHMWRSEHSWPRNEEMKKYTAVAKLETGEWDEEWDTWAHDEVETLAMAEYDHSNFDREEEMLNKNFQTVYNHETYFSNL
jgi:hypothetical protein